MKTLTKTFKNAFIICFLLAATFTMGQTTLTVNNNAGASTDFTDLQAAIDGATTGDILYVQQSTTGYGSVTINKGLTIIGRSSSDTGYKTQITTMSFAAGSSNTTIKGFEIQTVNGINDDVSTITDLVFNDNKITSQLNLSGIHLFNNVLIQGNAFGASGIIIGANTSNILITNNVFNSNALTFAMVDTLLFDNNIVYLNGNTINNSTANDLLNISNCIFISYFPNLGTGVIPMNGNYQINNCLTYNYDLTETLTFGTNASPTNTVTNTQLNTDPLFTNVVTDGSETSIARGTFNPFIDDLTLQGGSPATGLGIYANSFDFKPFGTPKGFPSLKIDSYSSTVPKNDDLTVTITAKTN